MAFYTGLLNRVMGITNERVAEAMGELRIAEKFKECISKIHGANPREMILAANEANKELASWSGIARAELSSLQRAEYMSKEMYREGIEGINRKAMKHIHRKISRIKNIRGIEKRDEGLLTNITKKIRQLSDALLAIEKTASVLAHKKVKDYAELRRLNRN
jgi:hypothetical protein